MDTKERQSIEHDVERLIIAAARYLDIHEYQKYADLFGEDGVWDRSDVGPQIGREQIMKFFDRHSKTLFVRHVVSNILIDVEDKDSANSVTYITLYRYDDGEKTPEPPVPLTGPFMVAEWHDNFKRTIEGWKIATRKSKAGFRVA